MNPIKRGHVFRAPAAGLVGVLSETLGRHLSVVDSKGRTFIRPSMQLHSPLTHSSEDPPCRGSQRNPTSPAAGADASP